MSETLVQNAECDTGDETITWETPSTPTSADDYIFIDGTCLAPLSCSAPLGKRLVRPYFFEFLAHVKQRWAGKNIVEFFASEFRQRPLEYYVQAVKRGRIRVDDLRILDSLVLQTSQKISHFVHRHEPPVLAMPIRILEEGPDVIIVCKPPSVPVHPCGQYRKNTVVGILEAEHNTGPLFHPCTAVHRLDRLVSGLLILARNAKKADCFRQEIEAGEVKKQYVAKVRGIFPSHPVEVNAAVCYDTREGVSSVEDLFSQQGKGKAACTRFQLLSTNGCFSIVRCEPLTGRTHQIRVHLQHLGHPIANDVLYLQDILYRRSIGGANANKGAFAVSVAESSTSIASDKTVAPLSSECCRSEVCKQKLVSSKLSSLVENFKHPIQDKDYMYTENSSQITFQQRPSTGSTKQTLDYSKLDPMCTQCPSLAPAGCREEEEGLWLHCVRYAGQSWAYECPLPSWAL